MRSGRLAIASIGLTVTAVTVVATGFAGTETGATTTRTYKVDLAQAIGNDVDTPPKGPSLGDTFQSHAALLWPGGAPAGSVHLSGVGTTKRGGILTGVLRTPAGDIAFQNFTLDVDNTTFAVTGGTGSYTGAAGTVATRTPPGARTVTVTVTLR